MSRITPSSFDAESVRSQFPVLNRELKQGRPVFLDSAASAQKPSAVIAKEREVEEQYFANAYRGRYSFGARIDEELEASRKKIASFIGAASGSQIAFTAGTTLGLNQVAFGWGRSRLQPGDEVVITPMEHHANFVPWQQLVRETGATLKMLPLTADGRLDVTAFDDVITRRTKIVAVCTMSNVLGTVNPVSDLARRAHHVGAILVADGAQSVPHSPTDVLSDDVDFLVFSGHKIYGPTGVGVIYGRADRLEEIEPIVFGGHMISRVTMDDSEWADTPARLEAGTLPIVQAIALGTAIDWVNQTGLESIHAHEQSLLAEATRRLMEIPGMRIYGPSPQYKGAIIAFRVENLHPEDLAAMLDRRGVFTRHGHHCTMPLHELLGVTATTRASFAAYNTMEDVDKLVHAIQFAREKLRLV
ncbi:MAG: SufS family cysteine desulfurase [Fuerstiella sp.]|nr:SufS family cysteine desulfurase [Fuerstiella sp.]